MVKWRDVWTIEFNDMFESVGLNLEQKMNLIGKILTSKMMKEVEMKQVKPKWVNIGADSKNHQLLEPSKEKVSALIKELQKFTKVKIKDNLKRLNKKQKESELLNV